MKKVLLIISVFAIFSSCKDTANSGTQSTDAALTAEGKDASYAFGINLGQQVESLQNNPQMSDSLILSDFEKGVYAYLKNPERENSYAIGVSFGQQVKGALENEVLKGGLSKDEIIKGLMDYLNKKEMRIPIDSVQSKMNAFYQSRLTASAEGKKKEGAEYLAKVKQEKDVNTTPSGLAYKVIQEGEGESPTIGDLVKVKYTGKTVAGKVFDSTEKNNGGEAIELPLQEGALIEGWIEALQFMKKGGKYELYIPSDLGYGDRQMGGDIAPGETLIFDMELVDFKKGEAQQ